MRDSVPAEWHIWVGEGPSCAPQVLRDECRPSQRQAGFFLRPRWLAAGTQASWRHWKGQKTGSVRPGGRWSGYVSEKVSKHRAEFAAVAFRFTAVVSQRCWPNRSIKWVHMQSAAGYLLRLSGFKSSKTSCCFVVILVFVLGSKICLPEFSCG